MGSGCPIVGQGFLQCLAHHRLPGVPGWVNEEAPTWRVSSVPSGLNPGIVSFLSIALRSRSGRSIINGNWAIDRPGKYEGGGTMFTYKRPNEISSTAGESFLAEGPTNEILDVYVSLDVWELFFGLCVGCFQEHA